MVLTNFELWAADGSTGPGVPLDFESNSPHTRHLNPFDLRVVPQLNSNSNHLSSNGYYGFSYVNAAHDNNNNNNNNNNNINISNNNNNSTTYNFMANDVNAISNTFTPTAQQQETHISPVNFDSSTYAAGHAMNVARCKKRFFVGDDVDAAAKCTATNNNKNCDNSSDFSAKRCRFDDDFSAQYCNDFFQLPSTQIATHSFYMETEEGFKLNNNNNDDVETCEQEFKPQLQSPTYPHQQQQQRSHQQQQQQQQEHQLQPQQHLYHQQQHYQDIQFATDKCHFIHNDNNSFCDTLILNKNNNNTCYIDLERNTKNVLKIDKPNATNDSIHIENDKYDDNDYDDDVANDYKVDDATLFAQLHGGCLHHHDRFTKNTICNSEDNSVCKNVLNHQLENEEF